MILHVKPAICVVDRKQPDEQSLIFIETELRVVGPALLLPSCLVKRFREAKVELIAAIPQGDSVLQSRGQVG